jgi:hypothetical protein
MLRGRQGRGRRWRCDNDKERRTDGLRKRTATARSKAEVKATACSDARDEVATCSEARIKDDRWQQHQWQAAVARWFLG